jgi:hypothetical protein
MVNLLGRFSSSLTTPLPEVKFEPEHVVEDRSHVEPITQETVKKFQSPVVQKTTASRSDT